MKNYYTKIEVDQDAPNPRTDNDNFCHMAFCHKNYNLGDEDQQFNYNDFDGWDEVEEMLRNERGASVIVKVSMTDHSSQHIYVGNPKDAWDSGIIGFAYVTQDELIKEYGDDSEASIAKAKELIGSEVEEYDNYRNDKFYCVSVRDESGEVIESCGGFTSEEEAQLWADGIVKTLEEQNNEQMQFDF